MGENTLVAEDRSATGKGTSRRLRAAGRIPAVVYGGAGDARTLSVDARELETLLHKSGAGMNTLIDLQVSGAEEVVLIKDLHREPVYGSYMHADFYRIDLTQKVEVQVPLHFVGKAAGVEEGGVVDHPVRELELECLPRAIPEFIEVDVSSLEVGESLHVRDLVLPEGVEVKTELDSTVATCAIPKVVEEEPETTEEVEVGAEGEAAEGADAAGAEGDSAPSEGSDS